MLGMAWRVSFAMYSRGTGGGEREKERERRDGSVPVQWRVLPGGRESERERERERSLARASRQQASIFLFLQARTTNFAAAASRGDIMAGDPHLPVFFFLTSCVLSFLICVLAVSFLPICCILSVFVYIYICLYWHFFRLITQTIPTRV